MKKILYMILTLSLLFSLVACNGKNNATQTNPDPINPSSAGTTVEPSSGNNTSPTPSASVSPAAFTTPVVNGRKTSADMSPEALLEFYRGDRWSDYVYSIDGTTYAYMKWDGNFGYTYNPEDATAHPAPAPWWETQELPEWMTLEVVDSEQTEGMKYATVNFYPDLPDGRLDAISADEPVYAYRHREGTYIVYSDTTYLYKDGVEQQHWNIQSYDGCFVAPFCDWVFDGKENIIELYEDGSTRKVLDHVYTAYYSLEPFVEALTIKNGALSLCYTDPYGDDANELQTANLTDSGVVAAEFGCHTIMYTGTDGQTYGLYSVSYTDEDTVYESGNYYTLLNHDCTPTFICLGSQSIDYYENAYRSDFRQRDDVSKWIHYDYNSDVQHFFDLCAAGEY